MWRPGRNGSSDSIGPWNASNRLPAGSQNEITSCTQPGPPTPPSQLAAAVLSVEEIGRLLDVSPGPNCKAALGTAYSAGLRVSEVPALKVGDIDITRMLI